MAPPSAVANGGDLAAGKSPVTSRVSSVYSEVQNSRLDHPLALPSVFEKPFKVVDGPPSSAAGNPAIGGLPTYKLTLDRAKQITVFIYAHHKTLALMRQYTKKRDIVRPGVTRFASAFLTLQSLLEKREQLRHMFGSNEWEACKLSKSKKGKEVFALVIDNKTWAGVSSCLKVFAPLVKVLRMVDADWKPSTGFLHGELKKAQQEIKDALNNKKKSYEPIMNIILSKMKGRLDTSLHLAAYLLNPFYLYNDLEIQHDVDVNDAFVEVVETLYPEDYDMQRILLMEELPIYKGKLGKFDRLVAIKGCEMNNDKFDPDQIAKLFPSLFGQPLVVLKPSESNDPSSASKIGVVLSGGQAPGGHNVISGMFDYLQERCKGSTLYGFRGGPAGIMKGKYVVLTPEFIYPYRNQGGFDMICSGRDKIETPEQFKQAEDTAAKLDLDGLVVIGGDDSNTNACLLAEYFRSKNLKTRVIGCPKTIDGDLKCKEVPTSFGFDTACKVYAEQIGNVMIDARSTGKYYHFVRLMGRAASHITLECALQTHPNITLIGEEVASKKQTLKMVTNYIADVICKRADLGYNYGVILIPEGLIDFIPEVQQLIAELNEILAHETLDESGVWKQKLIPQSLQLFELLPPAIQEQLLLERDPHGNVQVAKIETEKMLIQMVESELEQRKQVGQYTRQFKGQSHFFGYEGRCGLPSNFDSSYCYALGFGAAALLQSGKTGLISSVGNLSAPVAEWTVGGTPLTSLMDVERRHGKFKPVIKKAMVELDGAPFKKFASKREEWALQNRYISPGPIQFTGPVADISNHTLLLELGVEV